MIETPLVDPSHGKGNRLLAWLRWLLFSEGLILMLAIAGPGYRHAVRDKGDHGLIARWFIDEPGFLDAVVVNFLVANAFILCVFIAARIVTLRKAKQADPYPD